MTPEWWQLLLVLLVAGYLGVCIIILQGLRRAAGDPLTKPEVDPSSVTVIVPVRNEEEHIRETLLGLSKLDYPVDLLEIIIADDGSTDRTPQIVSEFVQSSQHILHLRIDQNNTGVNGKAHAIHSAINASKGDYILITDGDCRVPSNWINAHLASYTQEIVMVGGFTLLTEKNLNSTLFASLQSLDWFFLTAIGSGMAKMGVPLSIFGTNVSFRRSAYEATGGFPAIGFTLIEDFALMKAILQKTRKKVILPPRPDMVVQSRAVDEISEFFLQRKRWVMGARDYSMASKSILFVGLIAKCLPIVLIFSGFPLWGLLVWGLYYGCDFLIAYSAAKRLNRMDQLRPFWPYGLFLMGYQLLLLPQYFFGRSVKWKGRNYEVGGK